MRQKFHMNASVLICTLLLLAFAGARAEATVYAVKAAGGGNFTSISSCSSAAVAGDTCEVYAGSYSGWTQSASGSPGRPITFMAHPGDTVTITSGITVSGRSYITIVGFNFNGAGITGNGSTNHVVIDSNRFTNKTSVFRIPDGQGSGGADNVFSNNVVDSRGVASSTSAAVYVYGDRNRFENNEIFGGGGDCFNLGGQNVVVRGNYCHDLNGASGEHIDFVQVQGGGTSPTLSYSLIENNVEKSCVNDGGNCHFLIFRQCSGSSGCNLVGDTIIVRHNFVYKLNGSGASYGGVGDNAPNGHFYNNTIATEALSRENGMGVSFQNAPNGVVVNNIFYKVVADGWSPTSLEGSNAVGNGNIAFNPGYSGTWNSPYSSEQTYSALRNKDPLFANYPNDASLRTDSPAINAGVPHTTVSSNDSGSGTTLIVNDARFFQPGWAGTQGDWIRIGAGTTVQITAINYSTRTLTLSSSVTRSPGDPVSLYKNSAGTIVLLGSRPTVGAFQAGGSVPSAPTSLRIVP